MKKGDLLVVDAGASSPCYYASDITRTIPVGGNFTSRQLDVYEIVRAANENAVAAVRPGRSFKDVHETAALTIASGLKELGLMKGDVEAAVREGAHALFSPMASATNWASMPMTWKTWARISSATTRRPSGVGNSALKASAWPSPSGPASSSPSSPAFISSPP